VRARILDARAVVLPSFAEGLPVVIMESLALERPVVTTYMAGTPELVTDEVCGWLVPAGSIDQLACAIKKCMSAPDTLIQAMGRAGRERVLRRHDIARECRKLAVLFQSAKEAKLPLETPHLKPLTGESNVASPASSVPEQASVHMLTSADNREILGA
jgi:glycosyltransferase involved in cell wall biosynthesis